MHTRAVAGQILFRPRSSLGANYTTVFRNRRRETTRWRIVETPQHSTWHFARMLLECSWELLQNVMAWILNYVCHAVATRCDTTRERMREIACGVGGRGLLRCHWESMPSKGQRLTRHAGTRASYCRFLLPLRFFSLDQCRSAITTLTRSKENCGTFLSTIQ